MLEPITVVTAADIARVADVTLSSVKRWLEVTRRPVVVRHGAEPLYLPSATQAILDELEVSA